MSIQRRMARFNRAFANPVIGGAIARLPGFGAVHHRGRRSGREYRTPVKVFRRADTYVVLLPYGSDSDWVKNVLAAGGCDVTTRGKRVHLVDPVVRSGAGEADIPPLIRAALKRTKATEFLTMKPDAASTT
jgi:deazaflavin-dependent oxidoreductase (nitroreductase family)